MEKIKADVVMVSDIHIIDADDERAHMLESLIRILISSDVKNFILIGDIFDFLLGTGSYFDKKFQKMEEKWPLRLAFNSCMKLSKARMAKLKYWSQKLQL